MSQPSIVKIAEEVVKRAADYIATAQPRLDDYEAKNEAWKQQVTKTAAVLAHRGCIKADRVDQFIDKVAADPAAALVFMERLAQAAQPDALGAPSTKTAAVIDPTNADPFVTAFFPEMVLRTGSGLI